jgi:hypothetical protein
MGGWASLVPAAGGMAACLQLCLVTHREQGQGVTSASIPICKYRHVVYQGNTAQLIAKQMIPC